MSASSGSWGSRGVFVAIVFVTVSFIAVRGMAPAGAGVYYDDGVYLALAESLSGGHGYAYANLPGEIPGIKYPPLYPVILAGASSILPDYPDNLSYLKALNALLIGVAAAFMFLCFARPTDGLVRQMAYAIAALLAFSSAQTMSLATVLLSEPLWLAVTMGTLLVAGGARPSVLLLGFGAAASFLTRSIGISLVTAVLAGDFVRRGPWTSDRMKRSAWLAGAALGPVIAWWTWTTVRMPDVPSALAGNYGNYASWMVDDNWLGSTLDSVMAHWPPLVTALENLWMPEAAVGAANFVLVVLGGFAILGVLGVGRRNPALALFPLMYLVLVLVWPYEPDRFYYAIVPLLTMCVVEGGAEVTNRLRADLPKVGVPVFAVVVGLLLFNSVQYQVRSHRARVWTRFQLAPAVTYRPLLEWIRENTEPDAVVASGLDPLVYWETGRKAVPNFQFFPTDYLGSDESDEALAGQFEQLRVLSGARWVAVIEGEGKAGRTMAAFAARHPDRVRAAFEAETGPFTGIVYEVLPPGEAFPTATPPSQP
ncbi:MAG: hypothetical protein OEM23_01925 [Gemmatimonadota bacterium]|nr:hypothetical protein [Gemmatimonadota bacterium]